jgi:hypothetical protein
VVICIVRTRQEVFTGLSMREAPTKSIRGEYLGKTVSTLFGTPAPRHSPPAPPARRAMPHMATSASA